jgi:uncharacterized membrane protein
LLDFRLLPYLIRAVHVAAMALLLGGATLLWLASWRKRSEEGEPASWLLFLAQRYELLFWGAIGLSVMTGVGNLGALGSALPARSTPYGGKLLVKLLAVLVLIVLSLVRTTLIARLSAEDDSASAVALKRIVPPMYLVTTLLLLAITLIAVSLAHG